MGRRISASLEFGPRRRLGGGGDQPSPASWWR